MADSRIFKRPLFFASPVTVTPSGESFSLYTLGVITASCPCFQEEERLYKEDMSTDSDDSGDGGSQSASDGDGDDDDDNDDNDDEGDEVELARCPNTRERIETQICMPSSIIINCSIHRNIELFDISMYQAFVINQYIAFSDITIHRNFDKFRYIDISNFPYQGMSIYRKFAIYIDISYGITRGFTSITWRPHVPSADMVLHARNETSVCIILVHWYRKT